VAAMVSETRVSIKKEMSLLMVQSYWLFVKKERT